MRGQLVCGWGHTSPETDIEIRLYTNGRMRIETVLQCAECARQEAEWEAKR